MPCAVQRFLLDDIGRDAPGDVPAGAEESKVGRNLAGTSGKVGFRNRPIELIQYAPTTERMQGTPANMRRCGEESESC